MYLNYLVTIAVVWLTCVACEDAYQNDLRSRLKFKVKHALHRVTGLLRKKTTTKPSVALRKLVDEHVDRNTPTIGWVPGSWGTFPDSGVFAGIDRKRRIFVARSGNFPGMLIEGDICVRFELDKSMNCRVKYEVLSGQSYYWHVRPSAVKALHPDTEVGSKLLGGQLICRTWYRDHLYVGRVFKTDNENCLIGVQNSFNGDNEFKVKQYDLLLHAI